MWNRQMTHGSRAESKNCKILLFPTADRRFDTKVKCPTGRASFWVKFPTVRSLTRVNCPGGAVLELTGTLVNHLIFHVNGCTIINQGIKRTGQH